MTQGDDLTALLVMATTNAALQGAAYLLGLSIPALIYALYRNRKRWAFVGWLAFVVCSIAMFTFHDRRTLKYLLDIATGLAYYAAVAPLVYGLHRSVIAERVTKDALFGIVFVVYLGLPMLLFRILGIIPGLILGWFLTLSSYSYCVDAGRRGSPSLREFMFFTLIDPSLSFPDRALPRNGSWAASAWSKRIAVSALAILVGQTALLTFPSIAAATTLGSRGVAAYGTTVVHALIFFFSVYWLRSGTANLRIAMLEVLGFAVPVAYDRPYLASSPRDFWIRWNLYVGRWARRYIFSPVALGVARHQVSQHLPSIKLPQVVGVLLTFVFVGLLHDALNLAGDSRSEGVWLRTFVAAAVGLLLWEGIAALGRALSRQRSIVLPSWVTSVFGRLVVLHYVVMIIVLTGRI